MEAVHPEAGKDKGKLMKTKLHHYEAQSAREVKQMLAPNVWNAAIRVRGLLRGPVIIRKRD